MPQGASIQDQDDIPSHISDDCTSDDRISDDNISDDDMETSQASFPVAAPVAAPQAKDRDTRTLPLLPQSCLYQ
jgi:hypothetical protein